MLCAILCTFTASAEAGFAVSVTKFLELFNVRESRMVGTFAIYPTHERNLINGIRLWDDNWWRYWFVFNIDTSSINGLADMLQRGWTTSPGRN